MPYQCGASVKSLIGAATSPGITFGNGRYVAGSGSRNVLTSLDGVNWTNPAPQLNIAPAVANVAVAYGNGVFVGASGYLGDTLTSPDGLQWTVQDPNGIAFRLDQVASFGSQVYQISPVYQLKPPNITSLSQTIAPIPDDLSYLVKRGFLAYCYEQVDHAKFTIAYAEWQAAIKEALGASDREDQEFGFYPADAMQSGTGGGYDYVGWPGWSNSQ